MTIQEVNIVHIPCETSHMVNEELSHDADAKYVKLSQGNFISFKNRN
jgi:hypothetical protein